jgi:DNA-directed RNA polymerase subunit L
MIQYDSQEQFLYYELLHDFFSREQNASMFIQILEGHSMVTLRQIEHFLKRYSKKHNVSYCIPHPLPDRPPMTIHIHTQYMKNSKQYTTKKFDIFCRRVRIRVPVGGKLVETNIAQLNMFKWILSNGIIEYMENHHAAIVEDMYKTSTSHKTNVNPRGPKTSKRPRLTGRVISDPMRVEPKGVPMHALLEEIPLARGSTEIECV